MCQDSAYYKSHNKVNLNKEPLIHSTVIPTQSTYPYKNFFFTKSTPMYRPTRLGSSSPRYNTYKKNNYGAGAVTTNPLKGQSSSEPVLQQVLSDTLK